jgi:hypothetical protein
MSEERDRWQRWSNANDSCISGSDYRASLQAGHSSSLLVGENPGPRMQTPSAPLRATMGAGGREEGGGLGRCRVTRGEAVSARGWGSGSGGAREKVGSRSAARREIGKKARVRD